jgi:hypothetical protein
MAGSGVIVLAVSGLAQNVPAPSIMIVDIDNGVFYGRDLADYSRLATEAAPTPQVPSRNFAFWEGLGDIVAVNGKPMKGTWHSRPVQILMNPNPQPGQAIADVTATGTLDWIMDIRTLDGQPVGVITGYGWNGGGPPLGMPRVNSFVNMVITGGTGAYVGIRGQMGVNSERAAEAPPFRGLVSILEDPGYRRVNGPGQTRRHVLQIFPMFAPEILDVMHSTDFSQVTAARPAAAGEMLTLVASNLGPVRGAIDPSQRFPSEPLAIVSSPIQVLVNGREIQVVNGVGWPGFSDRYRVDFKMPEGLTPGIVTIQIQAAFLNGGTVRIPVR